MQDPDSLIPGRIAPQQVLTANILNFGSFSVHRNGSILFAEDYHPDKAAKEFWEHVQKFMPLRQSGPRMPQVGDVWRHYKGDLYRIVDHTRDDQGRLNVVYQREYRGGVDIPVPLQKYNQTLDRFLQDTDSHHEPRFTYQEPKP